MHWLGEQIRNSLSILWWGNAKGVGVEICGSLAWASIRGLRFKLARTCYLKNPANVELSTWYRALLCKVSGYAELWGLEAVILVVRNFAYDMVYFERFWGL